MTEGWSNSFWRRIPGPLFHRFSIRSGRIRQPAACWKAEWFWWWTIRREFSFFRSHIICFFRREMITIPARFWAPSPGFSAFLRCFLPSAFRGFMWQSRDFTRKCCPPPSFFPLPWQEPELQFPWWRRCC